MQNSLILLAFRQCTYSVFYFDYCFLGVNNLQTLCICAYYMYIGPVASNLCNCKRVQHTPSIQYIYRNPPLCHPCKTTPNRVMTMVQSEISSRSHKNVCLDKEDPWVPIVSLDVCTLREPRCLLWSHHHKNMSPFSEKKFHSFMEFFSNLLTSS
jgi:hypothetical protein